MIRYVVGDATEPQEDRGTRVIAHICNDMGVWGAGFVLAVSRRWPKVEHFYRARAWLLGQIQVVPIQGNLYVANLIAQRGFPTLEKPMAVDLAALETCLEELADQFTAGTSFHLPRIGCGIGGGTWDKIEPIIDRTIGLFPVYVYDLPRDLSSLRKVS